MVSKGVEKTPNDSHTVFESVDEFTNTIERVWHTLCCTYDASGDLPDIKTLFDGANLDKPFQAAKIVIANMLLEVSERVGRFSPWYTCPARAFGLTSIHDPVSGHSRWMLAPEAILRWQDSLDRLSTAINDNYSLIQAMVYVDGLMDEAISADEWITAYCHCLPPRSIKVTQSILDGAEILCDACLQPFS